MGVIILPSLDRDDMKSRLNNIFAANCQIFVLFTAGCALLFCVCQVIPFGEL